MVATGYLLGICPHNWICYVIAVLITLDNILFVTSSLRVTRDDAGTDQTGVTHVTGGRPRTRILEEKTSELELL